MVALVNCSENYPIVASKFAHVVSSPVDVNTPTEMVNPNDMPRIESHLGSHINVPSLVQFSFIQVDLQMQLWGVNKPFAMLSSFAML